MYKLFQTNVAPPFTQVLLFVFRRVNGSLSTRSYKTKELIQVPSALTEVVVLAQLLEFLP